MNITDVRVRKISKEGKMKAVVSVTIDDEFVVHDIKVIEGEKRYSAFSERIKRCAGFLGSAHGNRQQIGRAHV